MENVELDEVQWRSPEWVQAYGLRTDNVLDYFSISPFYDRSSNNQVLKMQTNFNEQLQNRGAELTAELQKMRGIEYQIAVARDPDLWVIFKQDRKSPIEVEVLSVYFVTGEYIYQSPSIYNVLVSRILATSQFLAEALKTAEQLPVFTSSGYEYNKKQLPQKQKQAQLAQKPQPGAQSIAPSASVTSSQKSNENTALLDRSLNISVGLLLQQQQQQHRK